MTVATHSKHLNPFFDLPRQKKTFAAILIMSLVANILFPISAISVHMARLDSLASCGWLESCYQFWTKSWELK